ncbi:MAG: lipoyl(octanoyl) transferase LipB [Anaerolineae bacterium]|nr:lipoyl(octanoyl) transferase LipB [Anaerolineae bacterium]
MRICEVNELGRVAYQEAWDLQNRLVNERGQGSLSDQLLLVEHPHTYTLGTSGHEENLLLSEAERKARGIDVFRIDRGGDITYHGPGQLVGYPIIQLPRGENGGLRGYVTDYVRGIEQTIIRTLADFDIHGKPIPGLTGVWVETERGDEKVCAIGVRINVKAVTKHGFALNINTDLAYFEGIIPCGITDKGVTSMARLLGHPVDAAAVCERVVAHFGDIFGYEMRMRKSA